MTDVNVQAGKLDYAKPINFIEEQQTLDNQILQDEQNYFNALVRQGDKEDELTQETWDAIATFSKSAATTAKNLRDQKRKEKAEAFAYRIANEGISPALAEVFKANREQLFKDGQTINIAANDYLDSTGDFISAREFMGLNKWEQVTIIEQWAINEAKKYGTFYHNNITEVSINTDEGVKTYKDNLKNSELEALKAKVKQEFTKRFANIHEGVIHTHVKPEIDRFEEMQRRQDLIEGERKWRTKQDTLIYESIKQSFVQSDLGSMHQNFDELVVSTSNKLNISFGDARAIIADNLVKIVSDPNGGMTIEDIQLWLFSEFTRRSDGATMRPVEFAEFEDLEERLMLAEQTRKTAEANEKELRVDFWVDTIIKTEDLDANQKELLKQEIIKEWGEWPAVPIRVRDAFNLDHKPDDESRVHLEQRLSDQGGILYEHQFEGISPTLRNEFAGREDVKIIAQTLGVQYIEDGHLNRIFAITNEATSSSLGFDDAKTIPWQNMNDALIAEYGKKLAEYTDLSSTDDKVLNLKQAHAAAENHIKELITNSDWKNKVLAGNYDPEIAEVNAEDFFTVDGGTAYGLTVKNGIELGASGGWKNNLFEIDEQSRRDLAGWDGSWRNAPSVLKDIIIRLYPDSVLEVMNRQKELLFQDIEKNPDKYDSQLIDLLKESKEGIEENREMNNKIIEFLKIKSGYHTNQSNLLAYNELNNLSNNGELYNTSYLNPDMA